MIGTLVRRLARLKAVTGIGGAKPLPVILISFRASDGADPPVTKATVNGVVWHRAPDESADVFLDRVRAEAKPSGPRCGIVGFVE